jgi:hypothetical protein
MVAATFINPSFETIDGVAPTLASSAEPFALADEMVLVVLRNRVAQNVVFEVGTRATATSGNAPFAFVDLDTLEVTVDGVLTTLTLSAADFVDITNATAPELGAQLATVAGTSVTVSGDTVSITSLTKGSGSTLAFAGTGFAASGLPAADSGVDHFADITNASAAEVVAQLTSQTTGISHVDSAGVVEMTNDDVGDDSCLQVLSGPAQSALGFDTEEVCGVSRFGYAFGWTLSYTSTGSETIEWHTNPGTLQFPSGIERFEIGWSSNEDSEFSLSDLTLDFMPVLSLEGPLPFESFTWDILLTSLPGTVALGFDSLIGSEPLEDFEEGWSGNESFSATLPPTTETQFSTSLGDLAFEAFEDSWSGNEATVFALPATTPTAWGTLGVPSAVETFESSTNICLEIEVLAAAIGDAFTVVLDGNSMTYLSGVAVINTVAADIAQMITDSSIPFTATSAGQYVRILQDQPGTETSFSIESVPGGRMTIVDNNAVNKASDWTGFAYNPAL